MGVNRDKPDLWRGDIARSVDMYNDWFITFAPEAFRKTRLTTAKAVARTLEATENLMSISPTILKADPAVLPTLRMATCPPLAVDRLVGLAGVSKNLVGCMEAGKLPARMAKHELDEQLEKIGNTIEKLADPDIFVWLDRAKPPSGRELYRASTIVADRLCNSVANPIIRNAQEQRQLASIAAWLKARHYREIPTGGGAKFDAMPPGTFAFHVNAPVKQEDGDKIINISIDAAIMRKNTISGGIPLLIEAKSAGDFTNVNKRRKEEATKIRQLRYTYGDEVVFVLFLCGYFDSGYLGYEAAEGIDWLWEHRIDDLAEFGI